jgi:hypothetical protein
VRWRALTHLLVQNRELCAAGQALQADYTRLHAQLGDRQQAL